MKRIPIYRHLPAAGLYLTAPGMNIAIAETEYELYIAKFFSSLKTARMGKKDADGIRKKIDEEIVMLSRAFLALTKNEINLPDKRELLTFDCIDAERKREAFSISESLYRIIEFYTRFNMYLALMWEEAESGKGICLSA